MRWGCMPREIGFLARPSRGFVPAADLLFALPKRRQKALPCETAPVGVPRDAQSPGPHPTHFATLRSNKGVRSQLLMLAALAPRASALLGGLEGEVPEQPQQPTAKPESRSRRDIPLTPFSTAEERKVLRPRAQHASRTDSARLSERSVAKRVPGGASRLEYRREPEAQRRAVRSGGALCLLSGGSESESPAGANSRHGPCHCASLTAKPTQ